MAGFYCIIIKYVLLTKREVKIALYWPICFCVFRDRENVGVNKNGKKREANI